MILVTGTEASTREVYAKLLEWAGNGSISQAALQASYKRILALKAGFDRSSGVSLVVGQSRVLARADPATWRGPLMRRSVLPLFLFAFVAVAGACAAGGGSGLTGKVWQLTAITEKAPAFQGSRPRPTNELHHRIYLGRHVRCQGRLQPGVGR